MLTHFWHARVGISVLYINAYVNGHDLEPVSTIVKKDTSLAVLGRRANLQLDSLKPPCTYLNCVALMN